jgi:hypothetical protein
MMLRLLAAVLVTGALMSPALAYCPVVPDNKDTGYATNGALHALCLETELARATAVRSNDALTQTQLDALQRDLTAFKLNQNISTFTTPSFGQQSWQ